MQLFNRKLHLINKKILKKMMENNVQYFFSIIAFAFLIAIIVICFKNEPTIDTIDMKNFCQIKESKIEDELLVKKPKNMSNGQFECQKAIEEIFGEKFQSNVRPNWLRNSETGRNLELDCYNEKLRIAIEYNGEQHYKFPNAFMKTAEDFKNQIRRDELKKELCKLNAVKLIIVPYNIPNSEIKNFIKSKFSDRVLKAIND